MFKNIYQTLIAVLALCATSCAIAGPPECPPLSGQNGLKLTVDEYHLSLNDNKPICTTVPGTFNVKIHNPPNSDFDVKAGDVTAEHKEGSPYSIKGDNLDDKDYLKITVEEFDAESGDDKSCGDESTDECAKFWIKVKTVGMLDPKVRVVNSNVASSNHQRVLAEVFEDLGLTLQEVNQIFEDQKNAK